MAKKRGSQPLPPRGSGGRFLQRTGPKVIEAPSYSPLRIGIDPIDWERELKKEVLPARRRQEAKKADAGGKLGWAIILAGLTGVGIMATKLEKPRR